VPRSCRHREKHERDRKEEATDRFAVVSLRPDQQVDR
jgi:hypothetical protein